MKAKIGLKKELNVIDPEKVKTILKPGEVGATIELIVTDKNGKVTEHRGPMRSKSFLRQFLELLWIQTYQISEIAPYSLRDTSNTLRDIYESAYVFDSTAGAGVVTYGIIAGTGAVAPTINDYVLVTPIAHGVGAGQLQYGAVTFGAPAADATTSQFTITRDFANASGGGITVNEIGLYSRGFFYNNYYYFMTIRDVIGGGILVPNGQTLTVNYRPQATV